jgi:hypothetical protein
MIGSSLADVTVAGRRLVDLLDALHAYEDQVATALAAKERRGEYADAAHLRGELHSIRWAARRVEDIIDELAS